MSHEEMEMNDDTVPHAILAHQKQLAVEKATNALIAAEEKESICDRRSRLFQDVERGQTYPINTFR